jgi:uncharacterized alkaline shock family protein YloU
MAAREVSGVHLGGSTSRAAGGLLENVTGSQSNTRGISVEVGRVETALDLTLSLDYGVDIIPTLEEVRRRISERLDTMTGLKMTECNITISDIVLPKSDGEDENGESQGALESGPRTATRPNARTVELQSDVGDREVGEVEPRSRTRTDAAGRPAPDEVRVEGDPLDRDRTVRMDARDLQEDEPSRETREARERRRDRRSDG